MLPAHYQNNAVTCINTPLHVHPAAHVGRGDNALCTAGLRASVVQRRDSRSDLGGELVRTVKRDVVDGLGEPDEAAIR